MRARRAGSGVPRQVASAVDVEPAERPRAIAVNFFIVDSLEASDVEIARRTPPEQKLAQALEMMAVGLRLKREQLRRNPPNASDADIEEMFVAWVLADD